MKIKICNIAFLLIAINIFGADTQAGIQKIALDVSNGIQDTSIYKGASLAIVTIDNTTEESALHITAALETALIKSGYVKLMSRRRIVEAKNEIRLRFSGEIDDISAARIGHFLGVHYIMAGNIANNVLTLQILEVETLQIVYSKQFDISFFNNSAKSKGFRF